MISCSRCAALPGPLPDRGMLYLSPPLAHTFGTLRDLLRKLEVSPAEPVPGILGISLATGRIERLLDAIGDVLSPLELSDTRSLILNEGAEPTLADLARMQPLGTLVAQLRGRWLTDLLRENRLTSHFQPIVRTVEPTDVVAHECLLRGIEAEDSLIGPDRMYEAARAADLLFQLDKAARLTAIRTAAEHGLDLEQALLFINFNPTSIYDPAFCLRSTVAAVRGTGFRPDRVVFEVVESERVDDADHLRRIVDYYRDAGFRVALDDLGSGYGSLNLLSSLRPDFVKLDMTLIRGVDGDAYKARIVGKLLEMARELDIPAVAEGIETEGEWAWVRDHGAELAQGYFIARPASVPHRPSARPSAAGGV